MQPHHFQHPQAANGARRQLSGQMAWDDFQCCSTKASHPPPPLPWGRKGWDNLHPGTVPSNRAGSSHCIPGKEEEKGCWECWGVTPFPPPPEQGGLKVMRRSSWTMARQSTKGSQPSTHQCMMSRDTTTCGEAQCEGVEKKAKFSLFQRCSIHSCWGPGLGGWLLPWYKSAEGCRVGPSAVILKGWKSTCEQAQSPPLTPNLPSPLGRTQGLWLLGAIPLIFSASCPSPPCV